VRDGVATSLHELTPDEATIRRQLELLDARAEGPLRWLDVFDDAKLPDGRPMPLGRRYAEMLVYAERLPLYDVRNLRIANYDPAFVEICQVADVSYFTGAIPGSFVDPWLSSEERGRIRAEGGRVLGVRRRPDSDDNIRRPVSSACRRTRRQGAGPRHE
jgi:hypothetical protein